MLARSMPESISFMGSHVSFMPRKNMSAYTCTFGNPANPGPRPKCGIPSLQLVAWTVDCLPRLPPQHRLVATGASSWKVKKLAILVDKLLLTRGVTRGERPRSCTKRATKLEAGVAGGRIDKD